MRSPTDFPRRRARRVRGRVWLAIVVAVLFVVLLSLRAVAGIYTDYLWFGEVHLTSVWRQVLGAKVVLALLFSVVFFLVLWGNLLIADRLAPPFRPAGPEEEVVERYHQMVGSRQGLVRIIVTLLFTLIAGPGVAGQWKTWVLFRNHVSFGLKDPQFHRDIGFFVFQLPFYKFLVDWAFTMVIIVLIVTAVAHYLNGGIRLQAAAALQRVTPQVKAHLSVLLAVLALLKAIGYWLQRYELDYSTRGVVTGATYTDVKAQLPAIKLLIAISIIAALLFLVNIRQRGWVLPVIGVGLWALVALVVGVAYPAFIQNFKVKPNEASRERPYIARNIAATQAAMNLTASTVTVNNFQYATSLTQQDLAANSQTIRNVRLWDANDVLQSYVQLQGFRQFFGFPGVDVDRYQIGGQVTQVWLSGRELQQSGVANSWVNRHLIFTHGYGVVVSPTNADTPNGDPQFVVKDLPPVSSPGAPEVTQPAIYYGENLSGYAVVDTDQNETDFPQQGGDHTSRYAGKGGVRLGSVFRRAAFALRFGDINPLISGAVRSSSRVIYIRDIRDRVHKAAPFLLYDGDPYMVVANGRLQWIQDAYTATSRYPYAQGANVDRVTGDMHTNFNYARNSVKVVIDAYDGTMTFYAWDPSDPLLRAYRKAFPKLFTDRSEMSPALLSHLRYPEDLFRVQTNMYGLYHVNDPNSFFRRTDQWDIAQDPGSGEIAQSNTTTATAVGINGVPVKAPRMDPYYLLMRLPNEQQETFLILEPFVPTAGADESRKNLTAFMVAKSDPSDYGRLETFVMPRDLQVDGPGQINSRINQDPTFSPTISLLNQSGSKVIAGNLLVIPVNQSLLYVRAYFVTATANQLPELKEVAVVYAGQVKVAATLKDALNALFGGGAQTQEARPSGGVTTIPTPGGVTTPTTAPNVQQLLSQAKQACDAAEAARKSGDLATYQNDVTQCDSLLDQAVGASGRTSGGTTTTSPASTTTTTTRSATA